MPTALENLINDSELLTHDQKMTLLQLVIARRILDIAARIQNGFNDNTEDQNHLLRENLLPDLIPRIMAITEGLEVATELPAPVVVVEDNVIGDENGEAPPPPRQLQQLRHLLVHEIEADDSLNTYPVPRI